MLRGGGSLLSRLLGENQLPDDRLVEVLESRLEDTERVEYHLTSVGTVRHEYNGEVSERGKEGGLVAVTDRRIVFVFDTGSGTETAEIRYVNLKTIEKSGLLRSRLSITVWGHGTYRFRIRQSGLEDAVDFVTEASDRWQRTVAALQDARQYISEMSKQFEATEGDITDTREAVREKIETAREQCEASPTPVESALDERIETVERELGRARMEGRLHRGESLAPTARELADAGRYDEAYETLERARSDVETALRIALESNFREVNRIRTVRDSLSEQLEELGAKPLERAERALERARAAETTHEALRRCEHALDCYRDALTAGWGTGTFDGETDALRMQVEWLVGRVVRLRWRLAGRYESEGFAYRTMGAEAVALDRYETAWFHFDAAERLARQYLAGDAQELRERRRQIAAEIERV
jgi:tetratricopeptide (TPR) repeat protein